MDRLTKYKEKRNQSKTPEPFTSEKQNPKMLSFVIQKHQASSLHYDLRLELEGVLLSWAIPKGPSLDNSIKRLAIRTEDHPIDYKLFEGNIPEGEYGAGAVMIWDEGYYYPEIENEEKTRIAVKGKKEAEKVMEDSLKKGEIKFYLQGKKLTGSFALINTKGFAGKNHDSWLLIKHQDKYTQAGFDIEKHDHSAVSNKSLEEISQQED